VTIAGYVGDAMEPFLSRDGQWLFFNNAGGPNDKDLFYATAVDTTTFAFQGALGGVNTAGVDGTPTMDASDGFYFVSTGAYNPPAAYDTLYGGTFDRIAGRVTGIAPLAGLAQGSTGWVSFDVEVSPDGSTLYFSDGLFSGHSFPDEANIAIAVWSGLRFERHRRSATLLANVNTADLEYAPCISADGRELFFTRLSLSELETTTYRATRVDGSAPFGAPQRVSAVTGFAEGPTLSPDERSLYFHRNDGGVFALYRVTR
jgi:hypothetical protein